MKIARMLVGLAALAMLASPAAGQVYIRPVTAQVSVGTSATLLAAARPDRTRIILVVNSAVACAFGGPGVTTTTGLSLPATVGATVTLHLNADVYAACASTATVGVLEETR